MKLILCFLILFFSNANASTNIALVYVDAKTEKALGEFPLKRSEYAKFLKSVKSYNPKIVILKFFFDLKKPEDSVLIKELKNHNNVYTQAASFKGEKPIEMDLSGYEIDTDKTKKNGFVTTWFPYKDMAKAYRGVGFVNGIEDVKQRAQDFEIISSYNGKLYPSLPLLLYLHDKGINAKVRKGFLIVGDKKIKLEKNYGMKLKPKKSGSYKSYSMIDVINKKVEKENLQNKVLIVFYKGDKLKPRPAVNGDAYNPAEYVANAIDHFYSLMK